MERKRSSMKSVKHPMLHKDMFFHYVYVANLYINGFKTTYGYNSVASVGPCVHLLLFQGAFYLQCQNCCQGCFRFKVKIVARADHGCVTCCLDATLKITPWATVLNLELSCDANGLETLNLVWRPKKFAIFEYCMSPNYDPKMPVRWPQLVCYWKLIIAECWCFSRERWPNFSRRE